jgi:hypothetical protein
MGAGANREQARLSRAQELLDQAIALTGTVGQATDDSALNGRASAVAAALKAQREKFFFKSLVGVPLANKARNAAEAAASRPSAGSIEALEAVMSEISAKADAPGTVLT